MAPSAGLVVGHATMARATFFCFVPRMVGLLRAADSPEARATAMQWANLNYIRLALVLIAWLAALQAFALLNRRSE